MDMNQNRVCPNCGKPLKEGVKFCTACGAKAEEMPKATQRPCPNCRTMMPLQQKFCTKCGANMDNAAVTPPPAGSSTVKKSPMGPIIGIVLALLAAAAIAIAVFAVVPKLKEAKNTLPTASVGNHDSGEAGSEKESATGNDSGKHSSEKPSGKTETEKEEHSEQGCSHNMVKATCLEPETCLICGEKNGEALGHDWAPATCAADSTCTRCGETQPGTRSEHDWIPATTAAPKTCRLCGTTEGDALKQEVNLLDLVYDSKDGKLYIHRFGNAGFTYDNNYRDTNSNGFIANATDSKGNSYGEGFHLDGPGLGPYYIIYRTDGNYSLLTGTIACSADAATSSGAKGYYKYIEIYCDGKLVYTSPNMTTTSSPVQFSVDVSGVQTVRIQYATTTGSNDICTIYDAKLQ